jgi:hypothetical protein
VERFSTMCRASSQWTERSHGRAWPLQANLTAVASPPSTVLTEYVTLGYSETDPMLKMFIRASARRQSPVIKSVERQGIRRALEQSTLLTSLSRASLTGGTVNGCAS